MVQQRAPSTADVPVSSKAAGHFALLRHYLIHMRRPDVARILADIDEYDSLCQTRCGRSLTQARVFEIGYGARPLRLMAMQSLGVDAAGVDTEIPLLSLRPAALRAIARRNGSERMLKSVVRAVLFDHRERAALGRELSRRDATLRLEPSRYMVGDASTLSLPPGSVDVVVSEDVFEHIPAAALPEVVSRMRDWLADDGLALVRPNVFTGITGGHVVEWSQESFLAGSTGRSTPPWGHLRGTAPPVNTFLNEFSREDYRRLFAEHFTLVEERERLPGLGREHLTSELREELAGYSDDELFSNQVLFVLRPRDRAA